MTMTNQKISSVLAYLGVVPFLGSALLSVFDYSLPAIQPEMLFVTYSAIILSFLGGTLWGQVIQSASNNVPLLIISNVIALQAWTGLLLMFFFIQLSLLLLILGYVFILVIESMFKGKLSEYIAWPYLKLRVRITTIVVILHGVVLLN